MKSGALCVGMKRLEGLSAGKNWLPIPEDETEEKEHGCEAKGKFGSSGLDLACPASHGTFRTTPDNSSFEKRKPPFWFNAEHVSLFVAEESLARVGYTCWAVDLPRCDELVRGAGLTS